MKFSIFFFLFSIVFLFENIFSQSATLNNPNRFFSPNLDGRKDSLLIPLDISDESLEKWKVEVLKKIGSDYSLVKVFESVDNLSEKNLTAKRFFSRIFSKDENIIAPKELYWDGTDNDGKQLADGLYYLRIYARDRRDNETTSPLIAIVLDTVAPKPSLDLKENIFSPNGDGNKEQLVIKVKTDDYAANDETIVRIFNQQGKEVQNFSNKARSNEIVWNGLDDKSKEVPEGPYFVQVEARDLAGNVTTLPNRAIALVRSYETADFNLSHARISPNKDGAFDEVEITSSLSSQKGLEKWEIDIEKDGVVVHTIAGDEKLRPKIIYSGTDARGSVLPDGRYDLTFKSFFNSGNAPQSKKKSLVIDTQAPKLSLKIKDERKVFNPTSGDEKSKFVIEQQGQGEPDDRYYVFIENNQKQVVYKKEFLGQLPETFSWDGKSEEGSIVPGDYVYNLVGKDSVENISLTNTTPFQLIVGKADVRLTSSRLAFSPNGDGVKDRTVFLLRMNEDYKALLEKFEMKVLNEKEKEIKSFSLNAYVEETVWDGADNQKKTVSDGKYFFQGTVTFSTGEVVALPKTPIYIDRIPIELKLSSETKFFSPNGDGNKDDWSVNHQLVTSDILPDYDKFSVRIVNQNDELVRENLWRGDIPKTVRWGGRTKDGKDVAEGTYKYVVFTEDEAGNRKSYTVDEVSLSRVLETIDLSLSDTLVSAAKEAKKTNVIITPKFSSDRGLKEVTYFVKGPNGNRIVLTNLTDTSPIVWTPSSWDSKKGFKRGSKATDIFPSGKYVVQAHAVYESGNEPYSKEQFVLVDNDPPVNGVAVRPNLFSPDGDGENEKLSMRFLAKDDSTTVVNHASIYRKTEFDEKGKKFDQLMKNYQEKSLPFKKYDLGTGKSIDKTIEWGGLGDNSELVESANDYILFFESEDAVGLRSFSRTPIIVDVLIEELPDGRLRIILNSIYFEFDSAKMTGNYQGVLQKLVRMLNKFDTYKVEVVGHTDSRGAEDYNQKLSEKRAKSVYNFLTRRAGISSKRLSYKGKGETELRIPNETAVDESVPVEDREFFIEENYRKNRRVEFYLDKPQEDETKK